MRRLVILLVFVLAAPIGAAEPDPTIPPPTDLQVTHDARHGTATLTWTAPTNVSGNYSFNVYYDGQHVATVAGTQASLTVMSGTVSGGIYQVSTLLDDGRESIPATQSHTEYKYGQCEILSITLIPFGYALHEECIPNPFEEIDRKVQSRHW